MADGNLWFVRACMGAVTRRMAKPGLIDGAALIACACAHAGEIDRSGGPFVPTPPTVVEAMLKLANLGPHDHVVDLGSGDGRIVLTAARRYKASGVGIEIDQELVDQSNAAAKKQGVADRVRFVRQDVREADLSRATVLTLYLLPGMMTTLRDKLLAELKPGSRVVSHDFHFENWKPDRSVTVETQEKYEITGNWTSEVHLWIVPARVQGNWRGKLAGGKADEFDLDIRQGFQVFDGRLARSGHTTRLSEGRVNGQKLSFAAAGADGRPERYTATVRGEQMTGEVRSGETVIARWSATRLP
jgi:SAM-dependent methyltransferase